MKTKIALAVVLLFTVLQFFNIDRMPYEKETKNDIFNHEEGTEEVKWMIQKICYNCHSNQINYPWYASLSPVSWWIQDHIEHGREHLNFSNWGEYSPEKRAHKAEEAYEEIEEKEMPLESYVFMHEEANLSSDEREVLIAWFKGIENKYHK